MWGSRWVLVAVLLVGCVLSPPLKNLTRDFDIAVLPPQPPGTQPIIVVTNNSAPQAWRFDWTDLGHNPNAWIPLQDGSSFPRTCNYDGFVAANPSRGQFYRTMVQGFIDSASDIRGGWCVGTSDATGLNWTWQHIDNPIPVDGARVSYTHYGIVIASGAGDPVFLLPFDGSGVKQYTVNLTNRRVVRTMDDTQTALVAGVDANGNMALARLWLNGQVDQAELGGGRFTGTGTSIPFVERVRDDPDVIHGFQLDDAWWDATHNVVWLAATTACEFTVNPVHSCVAFQAIFNDFSTISFDEPSVWKPSGGFFISQLDDPTSGLAQDSDTWLPRVATDEQGNAVFTATLSGTWLYPTAIGGVILLSSPLATGTAVTTGFLNAAGQGRLPLNAQGMVKNNQDYNGIWPDPTNRKFVWAFSASTQPLQHDVFGNDLVFFNGNIVQFGRTCDPNTRKCV